MPQTKTAMTRKLTGLGLLLSCFAIQVYAQTLSSVTVPLGHPANGAIQKIGGSLAVSGHSAQERWLSLVDLGAFKHTTVEIPAEAQFYSRMTLAGNDTEQLVFLTETGISVYLSETGKSQTLVESPSIYPLVDQQRLRFLELAMDVNDSGLSDLLIPDFNAYHLSIQQSDGDFRAFRLAIDARARSWDNTSQYTPRQPHLVDINLSGKTDIVFVRDGKLLAFTQQEDGSFSEQPLIIDPGVGLSLDHEADIRSGDGRDFDGLAVNRLHEFLDLDGDGMADLVVREEAFASAVEQNYTYLIYYGRAGENGLEFPSEPDTRIQTQGIQFEPVFIDINGNGRKDFYTPSAEFGVGTIIRALLRGSARVDIDFYLMDESRNFSEQPDYRHRASANVSIAAGRVDLPLVTVASFDARGQKSLLVGNGQEELLIHAPVDGGLFERRAVRLSTPLPRDGARVRVMDLTGNGKDDLVLPFDAQDDKKTRNQLRLLLTQ